MSTSKKTDRFIESFLADGLDQLPDHVYDEVRDHIDHTRQRVVLGPWKESQMSTFAKVALAAAAIVLVAVVGIRFLPNGGGIGTQPTPTASPTVAPTLAELPAGQLHAGSYIVNPLGPGNTGVSLTLTVPSESWEGIPELDAVIWYGNSGGVGLGLVNVSSLNPDPCHWQGTADDIAIGPMVDDLVAALATATGFETSEPSDVTVGSFQGKKLVITMPSTLSTDADTQTGCDALTYEIWNGEGFNIYAQGPENLWTLWILDANGVRATIMRSEFANSPVERRQQLDSIANSMVITAQ